MKLKLKDIILLASVIIVAAASLIIVSVSKEIGAYAEITVEGRTVAALPLAEDTEFDTGCGNVIRISDGKVYMKQADCAGGDCLHHKPISAVGEIIVCLPNRVTVKITGNASKPDVDAVA